MFKDTVHNNEAECATVGTRGVIGPQGTSISIHLNHNFFV